MASNSEIVTIESSYQLMASPDANRANISVYAIGTFTQDYEHLAGSGSDLDEHRHLGAYSGSRFRVICSDYGVSQHLHFNQGNWRLKPSLHGFRHAF